MGAADNLFRDLYGIETSTQGEEEVSEQDFSGFEDIVEDEDLFEGFEEPDSDEFLGTSVEEPEQPSEAVSKDFSGFSTPAVEDFLSSIEGQTIEKKPEEVKSPIHLLPDIEQIQTPHLLRPENKSEVLIIDSVDSAEKYLETLSKNNSELKDLVNTISDAKNSIITQSIKVQAKKLGQALYKLKVFSDNIKNFLTSESEMSRAQQAIKLISEFFSQTLNKFPKDIAEKASDFVKSLEPEKERRPQEFTSKWYSPEQIFIRNRSIQIFKDEDLDVKTSEEKSIQEWNLLSDIVDSLDIKNNNETKKSLKAKFAEQLLGRTSFDEAKEFITNLSQINTTDVFSNVEYSDEDWLDKEYADNISDDEYATDAVLILPNQEQQKYKNKIILFGSLSKELGELTKSYVGSGMDVPVEIYDKAQELFEQISPLAQEILTLDSKILQSDELYSQIYIVFNNMKTIAEEIGLDTMTQVEIGEEGGVGIINPIGDKIPGQPGKPRKRKEETERRAREKYIERIKKDNMYGEYLKLKREQLEKRKQDNPELARKTKEKASVRDRYYINLQKILNHLKTLAASKDQDAVQKAQVQKALFQKEISNMFSRLSSANLLKEEKEQIERELQSTTILTIQKAISFLINQTKEQQTSNVGVSRRKYINQDIINILSEIKNSVVIYFDNAKSKNTDENIINKAFDMVNIYLKVIGI